MRKADLLGLPIAEPHPIPADGKAINYVACFRLRELNGERVLVMDAYDATCTALMHRSFLWEGDFISCTREGDQGAWKWRQAMIVTLLGAYDWHDAGRPVWDRDSADAVKAFLPKEYFDPGRLFGGVRQMQEAIRADQLHRKQQRELEPTRRAMALVGPLPEGLEDWIRNDLLKEDCYLYYAPSGKKEQTAFCTACQKMVSVPGLRHGAKRACPHCGRVGTGQAKGRTSKYGFTNTYCFTVIQRYGEDALISRRFHLTSEFRPDWNSLFPRLINRMAYTERVRDILRKDRDGKAMRSETYEYGIYRKNDRNGWGWIPYEDAAVNPGRVCALGLREQLRGTWAQYSGLDAYAESGAYPIREDWYLAYWLKKKEIELVSKAGMTRLASEMCSDGHYFWSNTKFSMDTLKRHMKDVKAQNGGVNLVRAFEALDKAGKKPDPAEVARFTERNGDKYTYLPYLLRFSGLKKINDYLGKYKCRDATTLRDMWNMLEALGANMTEKNTLFPRNLDKAHAVAVAAYNELQDQKQSILLEKLAKRLQKKYTFAFGGLMIVVPSQMGDFTREGQTLNHCVRSYGERMARGETVILFVRREEEPETPYFTMEVKNGKIMQLRGKNNCAPKEDVKKFEKAFIRQFHLLPRSA